MSDSGQIAAIFDLDRTLIRETSGKLFFQYLRETDQLWRYFRRRDMAAVAVAVGAYRLGLIDATHAMQRSARVAAGIEVDHFWQLVRRWFADVVVHTITQEGSACVDWHRGQGHLPLICSASSQFSVQPVAEYLAIPHTICTEWLADDGRLTGRVRLPVAYGAGKVHWAQRWAAAHGVDLARSYFYSDDHSDMPLLERVAHPMAVNASHRLAKVATARSWPVLAWT